MLWYIVKKMKAMKKQLAQPNNTYTVLTNQKSSYQGEPATPWAAYAAWPGLSAYTKRCAPRNTRSCAVTDFSQLDKAAFNRGHVDVLHQHGLC